MKALAITSREFLIETPCSPKWAAPAMPKKELF
jgi:hypothetical protein